MNSKPRADFALWYSKIPIGNENSSWQDLIVRHRRCLVGASPVYYAVKRMFLIAWLQGINEIQWQSKLILDQKAVGHAAHVSGLTSPHYFTDHRYCGRSRGKAINEHSSMYECMSIHKCDVLFYGILLYGLLSFITSIKPKYSTFVYIRSRLRGAARIMSSTRRSSCI